jgi:hypothetical protein
MEYVQGLDLARLVKQQGPLPVEQACEYIRQAALGLQHIHEKSLVHRDIKPSNLFVVSQDFSNAEDAPFGILKILDLGLARLQRGTSSDATRDLTDNGTLVMGTLDYMAPEQAIDFHGADIRADIYSLGCAFYHILTGQTPFPGGTVAQKLLRHQQAEPAKIESLRNDLPPTVPVVLRKMMAKRPEDRFQTPGEIARGLAWLQTGAVPANLPMVVKRGAQALIPTAAAPVACPAVVIDVRTNAPSQSRLPVLAWAAGGQCVKLVRRRPRLVLGSTAASVLLFLGMSLFHGAERPSSPSSAPVAVVTTRPERESPAIAYLSDLPETKFQGAAFGKNGFLGHNGGGNVGAPVETARIIVKGQLSRKGVSMWAPSGGAAQVTYKLGKQYNRFKAGVGLHDGGWMSGSKVTFSVIGDGRTLWQSKPIGGKDDYPQECTVPCTGVDSLELQVTCSSLNSGVWPAWLDPQVTR